METIKKRHHVVLKTIMWTLIVLIFLPLLSVLAIRLVVYARTHIKTENGIDERTYVRFNNQDQYVTLRGEDQKNPLLVYLHGGPACPDTSLSYVFTDNLVSDYTVVTWDQRGCGKTYYRNRKEDPNNLTVTFDQVESDLDALVNYLCSRFNQDKVILVGHSFGSMIGSQYALQHPEKVSCYIGVSQMVSMKSDFYAYEDAREKAISQGNDTTKMDAAYQRAKDNWSMENDVLLRKEIDSYHPHTKKAHTIWNAIRSPYAWFDDARWLRKEMGRLEDFERLNQNLFDYCLNHDVREDGLTYPVPVGFISGKEDWVTPVKWTDDYQESLTAPKKEFKTIEGCGHTPQMEDPKLFQSTLKTMLSHLS